MTIEKILLLAVVFLVPSKCRGFSAYQLLFSRIQEPSSQTVLHAQTSSSLPQINRRELFALALGTAGVAAAWQGSQNNDIKNPLGLLAASNNNNVEFLASLDDALAVIDAKCDRRFLHAVVASDYRCLYRGAAGISNKPLIARVEGETAEEISEQTVPSGSDFLTSLGASSRDAADVLPSNGRYHFSVTNTKDISNPQVPMSFWPLGANVHFAWSENPREYLWGRPPSTSEEGSLVSKVIVDGIDCGKMSLEDALERPNGQVIAYADSYLMVPATMEQELIAKLKTSFII